MNTKLVLWVGIVVVAVLVFVVTRPGQVKVGSVADNGVYNSTTTYNVLGAPNLTTVQTQLKSYAGTFGSFVITGAAAATVQFVNATSTTDTGSTTIAHIPASTAAGTYTFDAAFSRGLVMVVSSLTTMPTSTVTFR